MQQLDRDVFGCYMYTDESFAILKNYIRRNKNKKVSMYLDATGSVVKQMDGMKKRPFYYALCLPGQWFLNSIFFQATQHISFILFYCLQ